MAENSKTTNYQKYLNNNPLILFFIRRFVRRICFYIERYRPERLFDIGCGEGIIANALNKKISHFEYYGIDINERSIETARQLNPRLLFDTKNFFDMDPRKNSADVVLCLEVLEHLEEPQKGLRHLMELSTNVVIVSVPWEPFFSLGNFFRGRYIKRWGNHPEHIQWFRKSTFNDLLNSVTLNFKVVTCFPWLISIITVSGSDKNN